MSRSISYNNLFDGGITTYHPDGSRSFSYINIINGGYASYHPDGSRSITYKNLVGDGYSTYHPDGSRSITFKNLTNGGYITYHPDGSRSITVKNLINGGYSTYYLGNDDSGLNSCEKIYYDSPGGWLGSKIDEISSILMVADSDIAKQVRKIDHECRMISLAINQIQASYGSQENGQIIISTLSQTLRELTNAESMLYHSRKRIRKYIMRIHE